MNGYSQFDQPRVQIRDDSKSPAREEMREGKIIFDSRSMGFPYMKKNHLFKAMDIQQKIDEPDDDNFLNDMNELNDKGTFTEEEYLNLKPLEKTILISVLEDHVGN